MTTTPNPTAERVIGAAMQLAAISLGQTVSGAPKAGDLARYILRNGNAVSSLSEGAPSDTQIQRLREAVFAQSQRERNGKPGAGVYYPSIEAAKTIISAAGVAPQEPCPQPCEHLSADDAREGRDCREHPCTCPTAPSSGREKLIEEARAVAGPKSLYAHTSVAHLLIRLADALVAAQGAAPQAEQATYLNVAHSSVLAGSINARRPAREVSAMQLIDAIYDPDEDDANDSVRYGYVLEQFERLRIIYADLDDPDAGPAPVLPSSGVDEDKLAEVERAAAARALEEAAVGIFVSPASADAVYDALRARAAEIRSDHGHG